MREESRNGRLTVAEPEASTAGTSGEGPFDPKESRGSSSLMFVGLSSRARGWIIAVAMGLGVVSLAVAWLEASRVSDSLRFGAQDVEVVKQAFEAAKTGSSVDAYIYVHLLNVDAHLKGITNRHALGALAIGGGVALLALGFALFLLGADGAFKLQAAGRGGESIVLQSSAPGLFCFLGAVALIAIGATRPHRLTIGDFAPPAVDAVLEVLGRIPPGAGVRPARDAAGGLSIEELRRLGTGLGGVTFQRTEDGGQE